MTSKPGLAGGIPERRVRPIWDAVDSRQFKTALKLSTALLAKHPNSPYAIALKALILERTGRLDEALSVCLEAKELLHSSNLNMVQMDDLTLSTLQIVFQRLDRLDLATQCYEHACRKFPNNLELLMGLFNCYVREYSFVKQQQTAIKLYKIVAEERFLLWAICSIQLQVLCSSGGEKLLSLAEALLKKHIASHSLHEPEAVVMYISILEQQAKYEDALDILSGNLGSLIGIEVDRLRLQGRLLARACNYTAAAEIYQKVLQARPDDWGSFLNYLGCLLGTDFSWSTSGSSQLCSSDNVVFQGCKSTNLPLEVFDSRIESALSFVQKLQMEVHDGLARCPYLASIEIERQCRLRGKTDAKLLEALLNYFQRFGHLSCFASDLECFSSTLTQIERAEILGRFIEISESSKLSPLKKLGQAITIFKLDEVFGFLTVLPVEAFHLVLFLIFLVLLDIPPELVETSTKMVDVYCKNLVLSSDLDPQENMHGEELLQMASSALVMLYWRTRCYGYLLEALLVLEFGLNIRKYVWQYKLSLVHLYSYVNALPLAYEWYGTLDTKNILLETVSHHIMPQLFVSPLWSETSALLKDYLKFMDDYLREAADLTFLAYRHRNYSKVIEFVQFKERLEHSNQYLAARIEYWILQLKQETNTLEEAECILEKLYRGMQLLELSSDEKLNSLTFNEDLQLRPWWSPSSHVNYLSEPFDGVSACSRENLVPIAGDIGLPRFQASGLAILQYGHCRLFLTDNYRLWMESLAKYPARNRGSTSILDSLFQVQLGTRGRQEQLVGEYKHQACENGNIVRNVLARKSLVPRLIYLSIQSATTSLKETVEPNASEKDANSNGELRFLLEKYARSIGLSFDDAVKLIFEISKGQRSFKDFGTDMVVDCMNFAVFLNAWNLCSNHPLLLHQDGVNLISWNVVENLVNTCIAEQLICARRVLDGPGSNLPILVQLITEPFTWHALVIKSCLRSMLPLGKKKKKSGLSDHLNLRHLSLVSNSIDCLSNGIQKVHKWLEDQMNGSEDSRLDILLSEVKVMQSVTGPGSVLRILEECASSSHEELGERIYGALQLWSSTDVIRKLVNSQASLLLKFQDICGAKLKMLEVMKRSF
ncbi:peptide alpha-N-acetyltransferase [Dendrobium catenatum]|uniref:Peptide alpha-N-acetyltransferase n=1 Tax=Dendrobium catenatum TaxID=906689 RepID=A0A2I0VV86_9ASPA|nr:peptide alpha-N-acetyltransferase [Dendrobium catenatum]